MTAACRFALGMRWRAAVILVTAGVVGGWQAAKAAAPAKKPAAQDAASAAVRAPSPVASRSNVLTSEPWKGASFTPAAPAELDRLVAAELRDDNIQPAAKVSDEAFLRRVSLDLTGKLPAPTEVVIFRFDSDPDKRSKVIDKLLDSNAYARHWAKYWRDVIAAKYTDRRALALVPALESWLVEEFKENRPWDVIARAMLTAEGGVQIGGADSKNNGAAVFLLAHLGEDQAEERAAETARVFLGLQIQCAQCHDHPFDEWKQKQFHEVTGYYARLRSRQVRSPQQGPPRIELLSSFRGEHMMPGKNDPTKGTFTPPRFLNGKAPPPGLGDKERRAALAEEITSPENFWFAAAIVNRMWGELMGQAFCQPVDDMGPGKDVFMPSVLVRLSASFRGSGYDIKQLLRVVCNSDAYQRQIRPGASPDEHLHFAAAYPTRLRAEALWQSLVNVFGPLGPPLDSRAGLGPLFGRGGRALPLELAFLTEFRFDPSLKADEVEGSIPQALLLMNNPQVNRRIQTSNGSLLGRLLSVYAKDDEAIRALYVRTLARRPTDRELNKAIDYVHKVGTREEAFEDLLWVLINSTEFQTKR
jgi:hypothetical protein